MADLDPDAISMLNDRLNELSDTLGNLSSSLQNQMRATAGSTQTVNTNTNAIKNSTTSVDKLSEANKAAGAAIDKASQNFTSALQNSAQGLVSLGKAIVSAEEGFKKYGQGISNLGNAAFDIGKNFGILGTVLGGVIKGVTMFAGEALRMNDTMIQMTRDATKFAGVLPATNRQVADLAANAGYAGEKMLKLVKIAEGVGNNLVALGGTAGSGVIKFAKLADVGNTVYEQFSRLGVSQEDLTKMQASYIRMQGLSGQAYAMQNKTMAQLQKESLGYAENLIKMSAVTGEQAEDIQRQREAVKSEMEERIKVRQEELQAQRLDALGRKEEAAKIRADSASRSAILNKMADTYGPEVASMVGRVLRTGSFDEFSSGLAAMGFTVEDLQGQMKNMGTQVAATNDQKLKEKILNEGALRVADQYNTGIDNFATNLGDAAQYSKDLPAAFAVTNQALEKSNVAIGKTTSEREEQAAKEFAAKKAAADKDAEQRAKLETAERELQEKYQTAMLNLSNVIIPKLTDALTKLNSMLDYMYEEGQKLSEFYKQHKELIHTLGKVVLGTIGAFAGYKVISTVWNVFKGLGGAAKGLWDIFKSAGSWFARLFGMGAGGGAAGAGAKAAAVGAEAAASGAAATGAAAAGGASKLGRFGKLLAGAGRILGKVALPVAAGMSAYDAYQGWNADPEASTGQKALNAGRNVLSGLTFGLVDSTQDKMAKEAVEKTEKHTAKVHESTQTIKSHQDTVVSDTKQRKENIVQNKKLAKDAKEQMTEQTKLFKLFTEALNTSISTLGLFTQSMNDLVTQIGNSILNMQNAGGGGANATATVSAAMAMQMQKESGGGKFLRALGMKNAGTMGGAYGMGDDARKAAYASMSKEEKAAFAAATGFTKAPTLNELVSNEGKNSKFLSDKAQVADKMLAQKFTENTISSLTKKLGRAPTMADVRGSHWLGEAGYVELLKYAGQNPSMTMEAFYAAHPNWTKPDMKQFPATVGEMISKIAEQAGGFGGGGGNDIVAIGNNLIGQGFKVDEHPSFGGVTPGVHKGRGHDEGRAIDVNAVAGDDSKDPVAAAKMDALASQLRTNPNLTVLWRSKGHNDHMHVETKSVSAAMGGVFSGSRGGYPATLHGTELVSPISVDSILMKLAKTPANDPKASEAMASLSSTGGDVVTKIQNSNNDLVMVLSSKLDKVIDAIENSNDTQQKILQYSQI